MDDFEEIFVGFFASAAWLGIIVGLVKLVKWAWGS